ncbi:MAG TPA: hypothetical protein VGM76_19490 [Lacipirellulaceae bacterium]|jgi:hypothetical protein
MRNDSQSIAEWRDGLVTRWRRHKLNHPCFRAKFTPFGYLIKAVTTSEILGVKMMASELQRLAVLSSGAARLLAAKFYRLPAGKKRAIYRATTIFWQIVSSASRAVSVARRGDLKSD